MGSKELSEESIDLTPWMVTGFSRNIAEASNPAVRPERVLAVR